MLATPDVRQLRPQVYDPAEDLFLLLDCLEQERQWLQSRFPHPVCLEIGSGSGVVLSFLHTHIFPAGYAVATDINPNACLQTCDTFRDNNPGGRALVEALRMAGFSGVRDGIVDVVVYNPPYVPAELVPTLPTADDDDAWLDLALDGGADGMELTWPILDHLDSKLLPLGVAYVLFCARNHPDDVASVLRARGWRVSEVMRRKAAWEVLLVLRISRDSPLIGDHVD